MEQLFYITNGRVFRLPPGMEDLCGYPLYLRIAAWGLRQRNILTADLVSGVFYITQSQARDVLHYIHHESELWGCSDSVPVRDGMPPFCKGLRILSVELSEGPVVGKNSPVNVAMPKPLISGVPSQTVEKEVLRCLRRWMVSHRPTVPPSQRAGSVCSAGRRPGEGRGCGLKITRHRNQKKPAYPVTMKRHIMKYTVAARCFTIYIIFICIALHRDGRVMHCFSATG